MASIKSGSNLDKWRNYFRTCNSNIFDIIENGIMVAALDSPEEFKSKRDRIAEILFSSKLIKCVGCNHVELAVATQETKIEKVRSEFLSGGNKDGKVDNGTDDRQGEKNVNNTESNISYRDAEALTAEIEKESQMFEEVLRIKKIVQNSKEEAGSVVLDSLRRLELMPLTLDILKASGIGKPVTALRKHDSTDIRNLARTLVELWKRMVDDYVIATVDIKGGLEGGTPDSVNPSVVDEEEGLPSPPLDDLAFIAAHTPMEFSNFFDGLDDELELRNCEEFNKNTESGRKLRVERGSISKQRQQLPAEYVTPPKFKKEELTIKGEPSMEKQATILKPIKPSILESGSGRPAKPSSENKARSETNLLKKSELSSQGPPVPRQNEPRYSDEYADQQKLEATKRKLQESYQQAENAKRRRTIQVMELHDLPKQGFGHRNPHVKPSNHNGSRNRQWTNGRR